MKFQKLTIHNIASIEDAVIDFETQPLADSEVFLITGKTGAGKSTILDAICLALFADTPRMNSTNMQGDTMDGEKSVTTKDPRQLMRRNTGEAFVSLTFIGSNGVRYEALWSVARANKKADRALQNKKWQLKNLDTDFTMNKDNEIKAEIHTAIGLDFKQFCRTTMLAQGEFTRFLNSKDDEKAEILEKITGVDVYSKIGAKVFAITSQKEQLWKDAQRLVEDIHTLSDDEIAGKQELLAELDNQYNNVKESSNKEITKRDWLKTADALAKSKEEAADALRTANEAVESDGFKRKEQTIKDWNVTIDARLSMREVQKASSTVMRQNSVLGELLDDYTLLLGGQKYAEDEVGQIKDEIEEIDAFLSAEADKASVYENAQAIEGQLILLHEGRKAVKKILDAIETGNKTLTDELNPAFKKAQTKARHAQDAFDAEDANVKNKEESVSALNLRKMRGERDSAKDLLAKISTAKERIGSLAEAKAQHKKTQENLAEQKAALEKKIAQSTSMDAPIHDARIKMETRKEDLDRQSDTVNKFASTLRLKLHVGDICPVCLQEIKTVLPHEKDLEKIVSGLKDAYDKAEKEYRQLVDIKQRLDAAIGTDSKAYDRDYNAFIEDKSVSNAEAKAADACRDCGIEPHDNTALSQLINLENSTRNVFNRLDAKIQEGEKQETELRTLRNALETKRKEADESAAKAAESEKAMDECKGRIKTAEALVSSKTDELESVEKQVSERMAGTWPMDWKKSPKEFAEGLSSAAKMYNTKIKHKQTLTIRLNTTKSNVENVQCVLTNILSVMPSWKDVEPKDVTEVKNLLTDANTLNAKVATALHLIKTAEESLKTSRAKLDRFLAEHTAIDLERLEMLNTYTSDDISRENEAQKSIRENVVAKKSLLDNAEKQSVEHMEKRPELAEEDTLDVLTERIQDFEAQLTAIGEKKGALLQELKTDKENKERLGRLIDDADKKKTDYQTWSRMNQLIGDATGNKFRKIAQSYVLTSLIHSANSYMKTLTDRYTLKVAPGTFVISLEDAYQGFVSRAASTISGGESFLVSLSLALALSDIGQTLSVDTLFIDEGFGTLSGEPLQNAINTLRSLHTKAGRHVGIISHVEELQERIPVQIQVIQEGNNSSSTIRIVPENGVSS